MFLFAQIKGKRMQTFALAFLDDADRQSTGDE